MTENTSGAAAEGASGAASGKKTPEPSGVDLARVALRAAKEQARARGDAAQQKKQARRGGGLRSGSGADGRDPMALGAAINRLLTERGWETPAAMGGVMGRWPQIVGDDLAKHCVPLRYDDDPAERVLTVQCDSTAWATQLRLLAPAGGRAAEPGSRARHGATDQGAGPPRSRAPLRPLACPRKHGSRRHLRVTEATSSGSCAGVHAVANTDLTPR
jgi:Zn-ribbon-containing, possibly RNA-binding protein and truncated derivatives